MAMDRKINDNEQQKEFIPKYKNPGILLLDLPKDILPLVREAGFNAVNGSFGVPYKKPNDNYLAAITNSYLPKDYAEKEVIIVDLTIPEERNNYPAGIGIKGNENFLWTKPEQNIINPRLVEMNKVRDNFHRILKNGGLFVIFAQPRYSQVFYKAKDGIVNRNSSLRLNNWGFLPIFDIMSVPKFGLKIKKDYGKEIRILDNNSHISGFLKRYLNLDKAYYEATFKQPNNLSVIKWTPIMQNKFKEDVGVLIESGDPDVTGTILILPQTNKQNNKEIIVVKLLQELLPQLSPNLFPDVESINWIKSDNYALRPVIEFKEKKTEIQKKAQEEIEEIDKQISNKRSEFDFLYGILTSTNRDLVINIKKCLEFIGFEKVVDVDKEIEEGNRQEDLQVLDKSLTLLIEVKGLTGVPRESDTLQIFKYVNRKMKNLKRTDFHGVFIVNHQRNLPPLNRGKAFPLQQEEDARNNDITILTSWDLFLLIKGSIEYKWDLKLIKELFYQPGKISCIPTFYKHLGRVTHYYENINVAEISIKENELHRGQRIGYITPTGHLEEIALSIQVDKNDVDIATPGQRVGIKTKFSKEQLGKAEVYIVS